MLVVIPPRIPSVVTVMIGASALTTSARATFSPAIAKTAVDAAIAIAEVSARIWSSTTDHGREALETRPRELRHRASEPGPEDRERAEYDHDLRHERQRLLLNLRDRL